MWQWPSVEMLSWERRAPSRESARCVSTIFPLLGYFVRLTIFAVPFSRMVCMKYTTSVYSCKKRVVRGDCAPFRHDQATACSTADPEPAGQVQGGMQASMVRPAAPYSDIGSNPSPYSTFVEKFGAPELKLSQTCMNSKVSSVSTIWIS